MIYGFDRKLIIKRFSTSRVLCCILFILSGNLAAVKQSVIDSDIEYQSFILDFFVVSLISSPCCRSLLHIFCRIFFFRHILEISFKSLFLNFGNCLLSFKYTPNGTVCCTFGLNIPFCYQASQVKTIFIDTVLMVVIKCYIRFCDSSPN